MPPSWVRCQVSYVGYPALLWYTLSRLVKRSRPQTIEYEAFLRRLIRAREEAGLNKTEASRLLGKARNYVSKCELGERRVDIIDCKAFAKLYGKDITFFCDD